MLKNYQRLKIKKTIAILIVICMLFSISASASVLSTVHKYTTKPVYEYVLSPVGRALKWTATNDDWKAFFITLYATALFTVACLYYPKQSGTFFGAIGVMFAAYGDAKKETKQVTTKTTTKDFWGNKEASVKTKYYI